MTAGLPAERNLTSTDAGSRPARVESYTLGRPLTRVSRSVTGARPGDELKRAGPLRTAYAILGVARSC